jgi:glycosyltransferase involved in cell wall biosynthesis
MTAVRILWCTNLQAPYREAVWSHLSRSARLSLLFLAAEVEDRPWRWAGQRSYESKVVGTWRLPGTSSDRALFVLKPPLPGVDGHDVVVLGGWESPAYWQLYARARRASAAVVLFYESTLQSNALGQRHPVAAVRRWMFSHVDAVLTVGVASADAARTFGAPPERVVTGFNPVEMESLRAGVTAARIQARPRPGHTFIYVGRLVTVKNLPTLLNAFAQAGQAEDRLLIVGDGPLRERLERQAAALPVARQIEFRGLQTGQGLHESLASAQTLVLPSVREVWGLVVNEALAAGLHVVVSERAGAADSVRRMTGVYVAEPTVSGLAAAMTESRRVWNGYIENPEVLRFTPQALAVKAWEACEVAMSSRRSHSRGVR